nr:unnamed protein product [Callosobruchus chinensis]
MRTYKRKSERGKISKGTYDKAADILEQDETKTIRGVAKDFGLCHMSLTTLTRYLKKRKEAKGKGLCIESVTVGYQKNRQVFSDEKEAVLVSYLIKSSQIYYGLTPKDVRILAFNCALKFNIAMPQSWLKNKEAGVDWLTAFLKRKQSLSVRSPEATSMSRATSFNRTNVDLFFANLADVMDRYKFPVSRIWNVDETGVTTVKKPRKIVAPKGAKQVGSITSADRGSLVTLCAAGNAVGNSVACMFVFPRIKYRDYFVRDGPPGCIGAGNSSGWMTGVEFRIFMKHFIDHVKPSPSDPVLLLLNNHCSHLDIEVVETAKANNVVLLSFPPHCSNKLQPMDVGVYSPFKNYYATQQDAWLRSNPGKTMTIHDIPSIVSKSLPLALNPVNIINSFRKTGIAPFNKDVFQDEDFLCSFVTDRPLNVTTDLDLENIAVSTQNSEVNLNGTPSSPLPHSSTQNTTSDQTQIQGTFSPEIIRPYPKAGARNTKNKRKTRKSAILTDTPEKDALALEQSSKKRQKTEQGGAGKGKKIAKKTGEKCAKRKVLQDSDEESVADDRFCLVCCESFEQSRAGEESVQCIICKKWSHVRCTKGNIDTYVCLNCDSDCSDYRMNSFV